MPDDVYEGETNAVTNMGSMSGIPEYDGPPIPKPSLRKRMIREVRDTIGYRLHRLAAKIDGYHWESW